MLVLSHHSRLLLLLFLACLAGRSVVCQDLMVRKVSTDHVEVSWNKAGVWFGVDNFTVTVHTQHSSCPKNMTCIMEPCIFNSTACGTFLACSRNDVTVTGANGPSRTVTVQTAPDPVTALKAQVVENVLTISWTNPSNETSTCYNDTAVQLTYQGSPIHVVTTYHPMAEETLTPPLCGQTSGKVEVWTRGGDGESNVQTSNFGDASKGDANNAVNVTTCRAVGCFGIDLAWDYTPGCSYVTHFCVEDDNYVPINCTEDTTTTSMSVTGLKEDKWYQYYIRAVGADGETWFTDDTQCYTHDTGVTNLVAVSPNTSSLSASWDSPTCWPTRNTVYEVKLGTSKHCYTDDIRTTTETSYVWTDLDVFTKYYVCVAVEYKEANWVFAYTLPRRPAWMKMSFEDDDSVYVQWEHVYDYFETASYKVTWHNESAVVMFSGYTIKGYDSLEALGIVCVATYMEMEDNIASHTRCSDDPGQENDADSDIPEYAFILMIVGIALVIGSVVLAAMIIRQRRRRRHYVATH